MDSTEGVRRVLNGEKPSDTKKKYVGNFMVSVGFFLCKELYILTRKCLVKKKIYIYTRVLGMFMLAINKIADIVTILLKVLAILLLKHKLCSTYFSNWISRNIFSLALSTRQPLS